MTKKLDEIEQQLNTIIANNEAKQSELQEQIQDYDNQIAELKQKKAIALEECNTDNYVDTDKRIEALEKFKSVKSEMLEALRNNPIISDDQYKEIAQAIKQEAEAKQTEATTKYIELADEMAEASNQLNEVYKQAGRLCTTLQVKIYKNKDRKKMNKDDRTAPIYDSVSELKPNRNGVIQQLATPSSSYFYKENGGQKQAEVNKPRPAQQRLEALVVAKK